MIAVISSNISRVFSNVEFTEFSVKEYAVAVKRIIRTYHISFI